MWNRLSSICHEKVKQLELLWGEVNGAAILLNQMPRDIQPDISDHDEGVLFFVDCVATHSDAKPCDKLAQLKWLGDVVVGACIQCFNFTVLATLHSKHDN